MNPFGHSHVDFHRLLSGAQGTIGIVTWATLKCCYLSRLSRALLVPSDTLGPLIDLIYQPLKYRLVGRLFILNGMNLACLLGDSPAAVRELKKALPPWVLFASFEGYGILPEEKIAYEEADFRKMAASAGLKPQEAISGLKADDLNTLLSRPSPGPGWKSRYKGASQDIFFLTTLDKTPDFVAAMNKLSPRHGYPAGDIGVYVQPIVQGTGCHCEFDFYYDPASPREADAVRGLMGGAAESLAGLGAFFSRPYGAWKDAAYHRAPATAAMQKKIKEIFDPNGILNPGKLCF
jgi:FAD/FMN-containing dehydrogenase